MNELNIEQILASSGALVTAVIIVINALKAMGLPGRMMPFVSIILGIGGAYLTISHNPAIFIIVGILVTGTETGIFMYNQGYFQKKYESGQAPAQELEDPVVPSPTPPAQPIDDQINDLDDDFDLDPEPEEPVMPAKTRKR